MKQKVPPDKHINQWIWIPRMTRDLEGPYKALALLGCRNTPDRLSTRGTACVTLVKWDCSVVFSNEMAGF